MLEREKEIREQQSLSKVFPFSLILSLYFFIPGLPFIRKPGVELINLRG